MKSPRIMNERISYKLFGILLLFIFPTTAYSADAAAVLPFNGKIYVIPVGKPNGPATVVSAGGKVWMDRNLGANRAASSSTDSNAYGDLYQWGRLSDGHEKRNSPITWVNSSNNVPGHGYFIANDDYDWRYPQNDNLWQGVHGVNNPCPSGFRLPTVTEWESEINSWSSQTVSGAFNSPLKISAAGERMNNGDLFLVGIGGCYWSSSTDMSYSTKFSQQVVLVNVDGELIINNSGSRVWGCSVRCIR